MLLLRRAVVSLLAVLVVVLALGKPILPRAKCRSRRRRFLPSKAPVRSRPAAPSADLLYPRELAIAAQHVEVPLAGGDLEAGRVDGQKDAVRDARDV